jgi:hypothetical protein
MPTVRSTYPLSQSTGVTVGYRRSTHRFDSGYTTEDIERILDDLIDAPTLAKFGSSAGLVVGLTLGIRVDEVERSPSGTVLLEEPCSVLDARLDAVCALISRGMSLVDALMELPPQLRRRTDA